MAEKEKKKGGKLKKLIIALVAISIVVGIVLAIVLSSPKGNKGIIRSLDNVSSISMIDNEESKAEYEAFTQKLSSDANTSHYAVEVLYTSSLSSAVNYVIDYYNDYYIFAKGNKVRKKQDNNIRKALKEIKSLEKQLNKILAESKNIDSSIHMQNKWIAYRKAYAKQFDAYAKLFKALNKVYHGSAVKPCKEISYEWLRIPHFYRGYYVFKYATGITSAICIASNILKTKETAKYIEFLTSGGSDYPHEILKKLGVDLTTDEPYKIAFDEMKWALSELKKVISHWFD